jgi:uncharacterized UPF0146 family protein
MISCDDAIRLAVAELDRVIDINIDRYRITLQGERDPDVEAKVRMYEAQLAAYRTKTVAELEREIVEFCHATKVLH